MELNYAIISLQNYFENTNKKVSYSNSTKNESTTNKSKVKKVSNSFFKIKKIKKY